MRDVFNDFDWPVAPNYEWQECRTHTGRRVVASDRDLARLLVPPDRGATAERIWRQHDEAHARRARATGPVLRPVRPDQARDDYPLRQHPYSFKSSRQSTTQTPPRFWRLRRRMAPSGCCSSPAPRSPLRASRTKRFTHAHGNSHFAWAIEIAYMREAIRLSEVRATKERLRRLTWLCDRELRHVAARLGFDGGEPRLMLAPVNLITALWLQLTLAITGDKRFVACKFCGRPIELSTDQTGSRRDREFCTIACKTKDYRKRKHTTARLANSGASLAEIADRIDTNTATVRTWLDIFRAQKRERRSKAAGRVFREFALTKSKAR